MAIEKMWERDHLNREEVASYLTNYLQNRYQLKPLEDGFVLAINAEWGFGKTFLLTNWRDDLDKLTHPAIYFDAWKNDFTPEPLIAFISSLNKGLRKHFKEVPIAKRHFDGALQSLSKLVKPVGRTIAEAAMHRAARMSIAEFSELIDEHTDENEDAETSLKAIKADLHELQKGIAKAIKTTLREHESKETAIEQFRRKLEMLVQALINSSKYKLPIFVFVDELDRCRPSYAIELLEGIKHLFGVKGIYFVIGLNSEQLSKSIKAVYGSEFAAERYLKRFFDLEYSLPEPESRGFTEKLFEEAAISTAKEKFVIGLDQEFYPQANHIDVFEIYAKVFDIGLRDRHRAIRIVEAAVSAMTFSRIHAHFLFFLCILYEQDRASFEELAAHRIGSAEIRKRVVNSLGIRTRKKPNRDSMVQFAEREATEINVFEVVQMYLDAAKRPLSSAIEIGMQTNDFPKAMLQSLREEAEGRTEGTNHLAPSIRQYVNLVRHAGHFSEKDNLK